MKTNHQSNMEKCYSTIQVLSGFLTYDMLKLFYHLGKIIPSEKPALEIGVFCGRSLAGIACAIPTARIIGVDPFFDDFITSPAFEDEAEFLSLASNNTSPTDRKKKFRAILRTLDKQYPELNATNRVELVELTQQKYFECFLGKERFQLIHIDGEHSYQAVTDCLDVLDKLLDQNAWIVLDDVLNAGFPGIAEAIFSHPDFRKKIWPVFYGFNKGVFIYNSHPSAFLQSTQLELKKLYTNEAYILRELHDGAVWVGENPERQNTYSKNFVKGIKIIFGKLIGKS